MQKCIVIPDSFKGSISSVEICHIAKNSIAKIFPDCEVITLPVADGGEGTVECFLQAIDGSVAIKTDVSGPYGEPVSADYARIGSTAIIEMAATAGLPMVRENKNPKLTTTFGVGQQMLHAIKNGAKEIVLGLGGSATNDGGCGCAAALGTKFYNASGDSFIPAGGTLDKIAQIDVSQTKALLAGVKVTAMCDIDNPMYGKTGAAYIFGPQKGADPEMIEFLDGQLRSLDRSIKRSLGLDVSQIPGSGAAGAFGAGCVAFFSAELKPGIEVVLDTVHFSELLDGADMVFTGEGRIDSQSLRGKVVIGVARRAVKKNVPVIAVVGDVQDDAYGAYDMGVSAIFSINRLAIPFKDAKPRSKEDYAHTFEDVLRLIKAAEK
ncbi:MAG: glycerate kinase [Oscillospiraceae bacterium]